MVIRVQTCAVSLSRAPLWSDTLGVRMKRDRALERWQRHNRRGQACRASAPLHIWTPACAWVVNSTTAVRQSICSSSPEPLARK